MKEFRVADAAAIAEGEIVSVDVDGQAIALARLDTNLYAFDDMCTHEHCPLSDGWLEGAEIECALHGARFDVVTGRVTLPPATEPLTVHSVTERDGGVFVTLPEAVVATE